MKNSLLLLLGMIAACFGTATATTTISTTSIPQPVGDTLIFALPVDVNVYQDIQNYYNMPDGSQPRVMKFQPEYIVTAQDFTKGDTNVGTSTLPAGAKVTGLGLKGYDVNSQSTSHGGVYLEVTAWCKNVPEGYTFDDEEIGIFAGYNAWLPQGDLLVDTITERGYALNGITHPGHICTFDENANEENPGTIIDLPFNNTDDEGNLLPFIYEGEGIRLTLWMCNWYDVRMQYRYMAFDEAETEMASLMRSGSICFNNQTYQLMLDELGAELMYELPAHRLPAFSTSYYTNDVRVYLTEEDAQVKLLDADGNEVAPAEDGNYYNLDYNQTYTIVVDDNKTEDISFEDMYSDIDVFIQKDITAVQEIAGSKTIASVAYYNLAGQQSAQPVDGVNIVVTTYTDGTRTTAKVIK